MVHVVAACGEAFKRAKGIVLNQCSTLPVFQLVTDKDLIEKIALQLGLFFSNILEELQEAQVVAGE